MKISYQDKELFDSRTFLAIGLGETRITVGDGGELVNFILDFIQDETKQERLEIVTIDGKSLKIKLTNWSNVLGTTLMEPLEVGKLNQKKLYILFFVKKAGDKGNIREVNFCAYLGAEVSDGTN